MSRGFRASESRFDPSKIGAVAPRDLIEPAFKAIDSNPKVKATLVKLAGRLAKHMDEAFGKWEEDDRSEKGNKANKSNKIEIAKLVKALPDDVRKAIELPKDAIGELYRGVRDREITEDSKWKNGSFVYGFTPEHDKAYIFGSGEKVIDQNDIESFGGLIDVQKVAKLITSFNDAKTEKVLGRPANGSFAGEFWEIENGERHGYSDDEIKKIPSLLKEGITGATEFLNMSRKYGAEIEVLAYDIKFKKTGDLFYND